MIDARLVKQSCTVGWRGLRATWTIKQRTNSMPKQSHGQTLLRLAEARKLLELHGWTVTPPQPTQAWDYTLVRKYAPNQAAGEIPHLSDL